MDERRKIPRWAIKKEAQVSLPGIDENANPCIIEDMHLKGMSVSFKEPLSKAQVVSMSLEIGGRPVFINTETQIPWAKKEQGRYVYGLAFNKIDDDDKDKIYRYIATHGQDRLNNTSAVKTDERRQIPRWDIKKQAKVWMQGELANTGPCIIEDMHLKGMSVSFEDQLPAQEIRMSFTIGNVPDFINTQVQIPWSKEENGRYVYGLSFRNMKDSDRERIYHYITNNCYEPCR